MRKIILAFTGLLALLMGCGTEPTPILPSIAISDLTIAEKNEDFTVQVSVQISEASESDVTFEVVSVQGTAQTDKDFQAVNTSGVIKAGEKSTSFDVTIIGDDLEEEDESFEVRLANVANAEISKGAGVVTLTNDDDFVFRIPSTGYESAESYAGMTLVWEEQFDGPNLDPNTWTHEIGDGCDKGICGWGNNELQYYQEGNTSIVDGNLVIEARREPQGGKAYTSSRIITQYKKSFKYGRIDIRAVMPKGKGMWPALWMLGNSIDTDGWPACGEIDIMEMVGGGEGDATTHGTVHWSNAGQYASYGQGTSLATGKLSDEYHVYSIQWDNEAIRWYLDDVEYNVINITAADLSEFREEFFFIINLAVGGNWPGSPNADTPFPNWLIVDYVKVFQEN
ncbi:MAG: family 16 glycosylhydrolase [Bacteroidota bacterium]